MQVSGQDKLLTAIYALFSSANSATLSQAVAGFLAQECAGKSPQTERQYRKQLAALVSGLGDKSLAEIQVFEVSAWGAEQLRSKKSPYTISARIQAARRFFRWLLAVEIVPVDLGKGLRRPKLPKGTRPGISDTDLETILDAAKDNRRDTALILFLASSGCRRGGAAALTVGDLDLERRRASVTEKGGKARTVIISGEARDALQAWLDQRPASYGESVFGLQPVGISGVLRRYREKLGLQQVSPHQLRHRFARKSIMDGMDISQVAQLLGHENVEMTVRFYGQFSVDQLQESYDRARQARK